MQVRQAAARLAFVENRFDQQTGGNDFVARREKKTRARYMRRTLGFALAAAQAVLDGVADLFDLSLLHDERLGTEQIKTRGVEHLQINVFGQFAAVKVPLRVHLMHVLGIEFQFFGV